MAAPKENQFWPAVGFFAFFAIAVGVGLVIATSDHGKTDSFASAVFAGAVGGFFAAYVCIGVALELFRLLSKTANGWRRLFRRPRP